MEHTVLRLTYSENYTSDLHIQNFFDTHWSIVIQKGGKKHGLNGYLMKIEKHTRETQAILNYKCFFIGLDSSGTFRSM